MSVEETKSITGLWWCRDFFSDELVVAVAAVVVDVADAEVGGLLESSSLKTCAERRACREKLYSIRVSGVHLIHKTWSQIQGTSQLFVHDCLILVWAILGCPGSRRSVTLSLNTKSHLWQGHIRQEYS